MSERWSTYRSWNRALADVLYSSDADGLPVYLDLEDDVLDAVAEKAGAPGAGRGGLEAAVRSTLGPVSQGGLFAAHLHQLRAWRVGSGQPPPIVALLAVFCLAAEDMRASPGVSGQNYYARLVPVLGGRATEKNKIALAYRAAAPTLWGCLNNWLEDLQGRRGLPTAYSFAHEYVGLPMSQALVRGVERDQLLALFTDLGLPGRSHMSAPDMQAILEQWIGRTHAPASYGMRALWASSGARERIVDVACQLLAGYEPRQSGTQTGSSTTESTPATNRARGLQLTARLNSFPTLSLELGLVGPGEPASSAVWVDAVAGDGTEAAVPLAVDRLPGDRWALDAPEQLDSQSLLAAHMSLRDQAGTKFERRPRRLVPFTRDDLLQCFIESERLTLGASGMLLCPARLGDTVDRALTLVARPGFERRAAPLEATEANWCLFSDVQVLAPLPDRDSATSQAWPDDLNVLQPIASGQVLIEGGLQLPGRVRRWSTLAPPELRIATTATKHLLVSIRQTRPLGVEQQSLKQALNGPTVLYDLKYLALPDGDYQITVEGGSSPQALAPLGQVQLRLRSADIPNPAAAPLDHGRSPLRSEPIPTGPANPGRDLVPAWWTDRRRGGPLRARIEQPAPVRLVLQGVTDASCFQTGSHHIKLPTFYGRAGGGSIEGSCQGCGLVKRFPAAYRPRSQTSSDRTATTDGPALVARYAAPVQHVDALNPDTVLDALGHDLRGTSASLDRLAAQLDPGALFARQLRRGLHSLGHLDFITTVPDGTLADWQVAGAALHQTAEQYFVLVGARSRGLLAALEAAGHAAGVKVERNDQAAAPARVRLHASESTTHEIVQHLVATGHPVDLVTSAPERLVSQLPALSDLVAQLPRRPAPSAGSYQRWNEAVARWEQTSNFATSGTFRLISAGRVVYCLRDAGDVAEASIRRADAGTVKHAAALRYGETLMGYDVDNATLYVPLGAELPLPYARVATACSGLLPQEDLARGLTLYPAVPPYIAGQLQDLLTR